MYLIGVAPALLTVYIRFAASDSALWEAADKRRREAAARVAAGTDVSASDRDLTRLQMVQLLSRPEYRRLIGMLFLGTLASMVGWWAVSTWIPSYAGRSTTCRRRSRW
jgi:hypothetical protein